MFFRFVLANPYMYEVCMFVGLLFYNDMYGDDKFIKIKFAIITIKQTKFSVDL